MPLWDLHWTHIPCFPHFLTEDYKQSGRVLDYHAIKITPAILILSQAQKGVRKNTEQTANSIVVPS